MTWRYFFVRFDSAAAADAPLAGAAAGAGVVITAGASWGVTTFPFAFCSAM